MQLIFIKFTKMKRRFLLVATIFFCLFLFLTSTGFWRFNEPKAIPAEALETCKLPNGDMHVCWIGKDMLSEDGNFYKTLKSKANRDNVIILASVDSSFIDMAVNLYETSLRPFHITNFLYICSDNQAMKLLQEKGIYCFLYSQDTNNGQATEYGSKDFILKMRVKMKMVTAAVMLGFTAVLTDLDVVFFRDPTQQLQTDADISLMTDVVMDNCGFYIARPTKASVELHKRTLHMVMTRVIADQDAIAATIKQMTASNALKKTNLDKNRFACGLVYYENGKRMFSSDNPCTDEKCVTDVVHNNWIVSKSAKIYRFKETGLWMYDNNGYYTNSSNRYIQYSNPVDFGHASKKKEKMALIAALTMAKLLNRTLILPKFHCYGCKYQACKIANDHCSFNTHFHIRTFDAFFENKYREHVFLDHRFVPESIKKSISPEIYIATKDMADRFTSSKSKWTYNASDYTKAFVLKSDVIRWFGQGPLSKFSVLKFHSLNINVEPIDKSWTETLGKAIKWSDYRQYKVLG